MVSKRVRGGFPEEATWNLMPSGCIGGKEGENSIQGRGHWSKAREERGIGRQRRRQREGIRDRNRQRSGAAH